MPDINEWNRQIIEEFHANGGKVGGPCEGGRLLLLTTTGARSGQRRTTPLAYLSEGDRLMIFASKAGAPTNPDWYHNLAGASFLSTTGQCKPFDAKGDGYCRGEGVAADR